MPRILPRNEEVDAQARGRVRFLMRHWMSEKRVSYPKLAELLNARGIQEKDTNLRNKVSKGEMSASLLLTCLIVMDVESINLRQLMSIRERTSHEWSVDRALDDEFLTMLERDDDLGVYRFRIGTLMTEVTIALSSLRGDWRLSISHTMKTPEQLNPYKPADRIFANNGRALHEAISALTTYYKVAVDSGHKPDESWLTPNGLFQEPPKPLGHHDRTE